MDYIHLTAPIATSEAGEHTSSCVITIPGRDPQSLWIRSNRQGVVDRADAFVAFSLLPAMKLRLPLVCDAPISSSLLEMGIPTIQRIYRLWRIDEWNTAYPEFHNVVVRAEAITDCGPGAAVGSFYSGGVDSSFSLLEASDEITDLLFIRDFEAVFPADQEAQAILGVKKVAQQMAKRPIIAQSNAKEVFADVVSWHHYHGGFLAGIALNLQNFFRKVHIPSTYSINQLPIWGSHPLVDPAWSTKALKVVHDRVDVSRLEKTAAIAEHPSLLENLRVCWKPMHNCGTCPKCVRTLLTLQVLDRYEMGRPFERPLITPGELARMDLRTGYEFFGEIEQHLVDSGTNQELLAALRTAHGGFYHTPLGSLFRGDLRFRVRSGVKRIVYRTLLATGTAERVRQLRGRGQDVGVTTT